MNTVIENPVSLESVITTAELSRRPARPPDHEAENRALVALARALESSPRGILQKLVDVTLELCKADSAGVSIVEVENGRDIFRWHAIAGLYAPHVMGTTPRNFSPCGTVLDRNTTMLFSLPGRHFSYFEPVTPPIVEALLVPFSVDGELAGTLWVMANDERRKFDAEDARLMGSLGSIASVGYRLVASRTTSPVRHRDRAG